MITLATDPAIAPEMSRLLPLFQKRRAVGLQQLCTFNKDAQAGTLDGPAFMRETWRLRYETAAPF